MNKKQLVEILNEYPDDIEICIYSSNGDESVPAKLEKEDVIEDQAIFIPPYQRFGHCPVSFDESVELKSEYNADFEEFKSIKVLTFVHR
jgi:hypothetical protein